MFIIIKHNNSNYKNVILKRNNNTNFVMRRNAIQLQLFTSLSFCCLSQSVECHRNIINVLESRKLKKLKIIFEQEGYLKVIINISIFPINSVHCDCKHSAMC